MKLWEMSVSGGIMILAILVVRRLFQNKVPKRTFLFLWTVAFVRLLVPVSVDAPWNVHTWLEEVKATARARQLTEAVWPAEGKAEQLIQGNFVRERAESDEKDWIVQEPIAVCTVIYCGGILLCAIFYLFAYLKYYREFRTALPKDDWVMQEWVASFGLRRQVQVRQSDLIATPMTYGILHPVILLPKGIKWEEPWQIHFVLTHEMVHIQRFDVVRKFLLVIAVCIHWWNPLVWVMYILANRDIELACDERVLHYFGQEARTAYALCLISLAERNQRFASCPACRLTGRIGIHARERGFGRDEMEERIVAIMKKKRPTAGAMAGAGVLVIFVLALFVVSIFQEDTRVDDTVVEKEQVLADTKPIKIEKVADLGEISDSGGYIFLPVPQKDPAKISVEKYPAAISVEKAMDSETVYEGEGETGFLQLCQNIYHSEEYPEYEKFGLIYDEENGHFLYQGEIVGYFKDEMEPGLYRKFTDEAGNIGIVALRDNSWNIIGFQEKR